MVNPQHDRTLAATEEIGESESCDQLNGQRGSSAPTAAGASELTP